MHTFAEAKQCAFGCIARPSIWQQRKIFNLLVSYGTKSHPLLEVEGPGPLHCLLGHVSLQARGHLAPMWGSSRSPSFTKQTMVVQHPHVPLWVRYVDVDSTHQMLMSARSAIL